MSEPTVGERKRMVSPESQVELEVLTRCRRRDSAKEACALKGVMREVLKKKRKKMSV